MTETLPDHHRLKSRPRVHDRGACRDPLTGNAPEAISPKARIRFACKGAQIAANGFTERKLKA
jgi:hypothetical protein